MPDLDEQRQEMALYLIVYVYCTEAIAGKNARYGRATAKWKYQEAVLETMVVVIGGGATGMGTLRDLCMRGVPAILLEQGGLAHGTSSRFHGLLHSGGRYAVNDNESARECIEENMIVRRIGRQCVEETEGFFALTPDDDPADVTPWAEACHKAGIDAQELDDQRPTVWSPISRPTSGASSVCLIPVWTAFAWYCTTPCPPSVTAAGC